MIQGGGAKLKWWNWWQINLNSHLIVFWSFICCMVPSWTSGGKKRLEGLCPKSIHTSKIAGIGYYCPFPPTNSLIFHISVLHFSQSSCFPSSLHCITHLLELPHPFSNAWLEGMTWKPNVYLHKSITSISVNNHPSITKFYVTVKFVIFWYCSSQDLQVVSLCDSSQRISSIWETYLLYRVWFA